MLRTISRALVALALLAGPAAAQSFTLPELGLQSAGACRQLAARDRSNNAMVALGCLDTTKHGWVLTPSTLQIAGSGSTGDVSGMSVTAGGATRSLATWLPTFASVASPVFTGTMTAPTLALTGSGSSGDVSGMSVSPNAGAATGTLAKIVAGMVSSSNPTFTGTMSAATGVLTGPMTVGGTATASSTQGLDFQFVARRNFTGTAGYGVNGSLINVENDAATITGPNFANVFNVQNSNFGGPNAQGGRQAIQASVYQTAPTSASNTNRNYVGILGGAYSSSGDGGTALTANGARGGYFGMNPVAILSSGATNVFNLAGLEVNVAAQTGSSVYYKAGIQIAALASDTVPGTFIDAGITIGAQGGAQLMKQGIYFGTQNGGWPFNGSSSVIKASGGQVGTALDFSGVGITDSLLKGPSGAILDLSNKWSIAHGGSVLLNIIGLSNGNPLTNAQPIALIGQSGLSPYWLTAVDFTVRSNSASGVLDIPGTVTTGAVTANGYLTIKVNGTTVKLVTAQ